MRYPLRTVRQASESKDIPRRNFPTTRARKQSPLQNLSPCRQAVSLFNWKRICRLGIGYMDSNLSGVVVHYRDYVIRADKIVLSPRILRNWKPKGTCR